MDGIIDWIDMSLSKLPKVLKDRKPGMLQFMGLKRDRHDLATEQQQQSVIHNSEDQLWL